MITTRESLDELKITLSLMTSDGLFTLTYTNKMNTQTMSYFSNGAAEFILDLNNEEVQLFETALKQGNTNEIKNF